MDIRQLYSHISVLPFDITFQVAIKNILLLLSQLVEDDSLEKEDKDNENKHPEKKTRFKPFPIFILIIIAFFFGRNSNSFHNKNDIIANKEVSHHSSRQSKSNDMIYRLNKWQCDFILLEFRGEFWKYVHLNEIEKVETFTEKDKLILKENLWDKLNKARRIFSNIEGMSTIERKVETYYNYDRFENDFNIFMMTHTNGSLEDFEREMIEYIRIKQNEILEKVLKK